MKIKLKQKQNPNPRAHIILFQANSPFRPKQVKSPLEYQRNPKHRKQGENDE
jgi:hypothetical protein